MTFLVAFSVAWLALLGAVCWFVWRAQREKRTISARWRDNETYHRDGDVPPGTRR